MDYKKRPLWQWILLYVVIGGILYAIVYFVFLKGAYSTKSNSTNSNPYGQNTAPSKTPAQAKTTTPTTDNSSSTTNTNNSNTTPTNTSASKSFTVNADDTGADMETISVAKGTPVNLTFAVKTGTTYHGGLEFVGNNIDTGTITPGSSKTVQFTADKSFSFIPYWPANSVKKDYTIDIQVN